MKPLKLIALWIVAICTFTMISCDKDPVEPIDPPVGEYQFEVGTAKTASFFGEIVDENNMPVAGADISIGNKNATTNSDGVFFIEDASVFENHAYVKAVKSGYFLGSRSLRPTDGVNKVRIMLLDKIDAGDFDAAAGGSVSADGVSIDFVGGVVDASGTAYSGNVNVAANYIDPEGDDLAFEMPGNLIGANEDGGQTLKSLGMVAVELTDDAGNKLQLADGSPAEITFPLSAALLADAPSSIPLWSFDEAAGYWIYEGDAVLEGSTYKASVSHFSFWNCDIPAAYTTIEGRLVDALGVGYADALIKIVSPANGTGWGYSDHNGYYAGIIPANASLTIEVHLPCGPGTFTIVHSSSVGPFAVGTPAIIPDITISPAGAGVTAVTGTVVDCTNNPVANGYVKFNNSISYLSAGSFNMLLCSGTTIDVKAVDIDNLTESGTTSYTVTGPTMNIGQIVACNALTEYIIWTANGTDLACTSGFSVSSQGPTFNSISASTPSYFYFNSYNFTGVGSYVLDPNNFLEIELPGIDSLNYSPMGTIILTQYGTNSGDLIEGNFSGTYDLSVGGTANFSGNIHFFHP